jgi:hypothetical protein
MPCPSTQSAHACHTSRAREFEFGFEFVAPGLQAGIFGRPVGSTRFRSKVTIAKKAAMNALPAHQTIPSSQKINFSFC